MLGIITGTRPEIIKMFPLIKQLEKDDIEYKYIHTGQHYDHALSSLFYDEFDLRRPDYKIDLSGSLSNYSKQISEIMVKLRSIFRHEKFSGVIVQGDTNSVLASSLEAVRHNVPVYHVEAGLRCFDMRLQEEKNRTIVDHISSFLFAPTTISKQNLVKEKVKGEIFIVGNTIMDAINIILEGNKNKDIQNFLRDKYDQKKFILVTLHRTESLSNKRFLISFFLSLKESNLNYIFPLHPHTLKQIKRFNLEYIFQNEKITFIPPLGYSEFLNLLQICRFVITDSGGVQEEITSNLINKYAIIVRSSTERPESITSGHSILLGNFSRKNLTDQIINLDKIVDCNGTCKLTTNPYGVGDSAKKIVDVIKQMRDEPL